MLLSYLCIISKLEELRGYKVVPVMYHFVSRVQAKMALSVSNGTFLHDQVWRLTFFNFEIKFSIVVSLQKWFIHIYYRNTKLSELNTFNLEKWKYLPHHWSDKDFKGNIVNRALQSLPGGSLEITLTVQLMNNFFLDFKFIRIL